MPDQERNLAIWAEAYRYMPSWAWETDAQYRLSYIQSNMTDWTGVPVEELIGFNILLDEYDAKEGTNSNAYIEALRAKQTIECMAYERVLLSGEKAVLVDSASPRFDATGAFAGYSGVSINLTEIMKQADDTDSLVMGLKSRADQLEKTLSEQNQALQASNELLQGVLEAMGEGLMVTSGTDPIDPNNQIMMVNQAYRELFEFGPETKIKGRSLSEYAGFLVGENLVRATAAEFEDIGARLLAGDSVVMEIPKTNRFYYVRATPGPQGGSVYVHRDITELEQKNEALRSARDAAEVASLAKSNFLATMSHEIRTPMNGIVGMASLLSECDLDAEAADYVKTINSAALALTHLISEILDFSKIEAGHLEIKPVAFDPRLLVKEMYDLMQPLASKKGLELRCELDVNIPDVLFGDPLRLRQILLNLLGNAVKFTSEGFVRLKMALGDRVHIQVSDSGIGIPEDDLPFIFHAFQQVETGRERQFEGTGLGLSITKQLVDAMDGRIVVDSALGYGTVFDLWLPLGQEVEAPLEPTAPPIDHIDLSGVRVLVVEDNRTNQAVVQKLLEKRGAVVTLAANGKQAINCYGPALFDVLLMDISMPVMTGLEAARSIRSIEHRRGWPRTPILALTGNALERDREEALSAGMDGFLNKPVQRDDLMRALALHLPKQNARADQTPRRA
ncbi:MAG: ATP-binding protein [Pseudomonadota bacterium]